MRREDRAWKGLGTSTQFGLDVGAAERTKGGRGGKGEEGRRGGKERREGEARRRGGKERSEREEGRKQGKNLGEGNWRKRNEDEEEIGEEENGKGGFALRQFYDEYKPIHPPNKVPINLPTIL